MRAGLEERYEGIEGEIRSGGGKLEDVKTRKKMWIL
jgi:hypothetical protein